MILHDNMVLLKSMFNSYHAILVVYSQVRKHIETLMYMSGCLISSRLNPYQSVANSYTQLVTYTSHLNTWFMYDIC